MSDRKPIQVNERTHEIVRREAFSQSLESDIDIGDVSMGDVISKMAEKIQRKRKYKSLPGDTK